MTTPISDILSPDPRRFPGVSCCHFSPYSPDTCIFTSNEFFRMTGSSRLSIYNFSLNKYIHDIHIPQTLFGIASSEAGLTNIIYGINGVGQLQIINLNNRDNQVINNKTGAKVEGGSISVSTMSNVDNIITCSFQNTIDYYRDSILINSFNTPGLIVTNCQWSYHCANTFAYSSNTGSIGIQDIRQSNVNNEIHSSCPHEVLGIDFNKYNSNLLHVGASDGSIFLFDLRNLNIPINSLLQVHSLPIKQIVSSPHSERVIGTASFDQFYSLCRDNSILNKTRRHSEFCMGIDFSRFDPNLIMTCGWDGLVCIDRMI